jgi:hypothetical protein
MPLRDRVRAGAEQGPFGDGLLGQAQALYQAGVASAELHLPPAVAHACPSGIVCGGRRAPIEDKRPMPKKPGTNPKGEFALFNVVYEDNSVRSNCRVPNEILGGLKGDEPARGFIHGAGPRDRPERWPPRSLDQAYRAGRREQEVAALPSPAMNSRRRIRDLRRPGGTDHSAGS